MRRTGRQTIHPVVGDIEHLDGCPAERLESYPQTRADGIEVMTGHCLDCGQLAYRHGSTPTSRSESQDGPPVSLNDGSAADLRPVLMSLIRRGTEVKEEALMAGNAAERKFDRPSTAEVAADLEHLRKREAEWTEEVEAGLTGDDLQRFAGTHGIPSTGHYAIHNRLQARLAVLQDIRDAL
jgi:hypothetical protein